MLKPWSWGTHVAGIIIHKDAARSRETLGHWLPVVALEYISYPLAFAYFRLATWISQSHF